MKLRIVRVVSKETGLTQGYELQSRVLPFWWATLVSYKEGGSYVRPAKSMIEHDIVFFLTLHGYLDTKECFV